MDRDDYYGGESTSLNLIQLWKKFRGDDKPPPHLGSSKDYNIDMNPKEQWWDCCWLPTLRVNSVLSAKMRHGNQHLTIVHFGLF
ncbi:guanosine nucleotide diphosphate dissociation inhibitor [Trifolium repens]|nr:guanosine nucleotide diphosphate dissociation inhibitor [Trifolium repens]